MFHFALNIVTKGRGVLSPFLRDVSHRSKMPPKQGYPNFDPDNVCAVVGDENCDPIGGTIFNVIMHFWSFERDY